MRSQNRPSPALMLSAVVCSLCCLLLLSGCSSSGSTNQVSREIARLAPGATPEQSASENLNFRARQIVEAALAGNVAFTILESLLTAAPKRLSGSSGAADAVVWGEAMMNSLGLVNVRTEPVVVPRWIRGIETAAMTSTSAASAQSSFDPELSIAALGGSVATPDGGVEASVIEVRSFEQLADIGAGAAGKIVFFNRPMPRRFANTFHAYRDSVGQRASGAIMAANVGAVAVLVRSMTTTIDDNPHTGMMNYADDVERIPAAAVSTVDADRLSAMLKESEVTVRMNLTCRSETDVMSANVVGELRGSKHPEQVVVLGGHLDAWDLGDGAHDDGAGIAHVLAVAKLLKDCDIQPARTLRFVLYMNEENGLRGGRAYVSEHKSAMPQHYAAIESDAGGFEPRGISASLPEGARAGVEEAMRALKPWGMSAVLPGGGGADIGPMREFDVPLFGMVITSHRYFDVHHAATDTIESVNERELNLGAACLAFAVTVIAETEGLR